MALISDQSYFCSIISLLPWFPFAGAHASAQTFTSPWNQKMGKHSTAQSIFAAFDIQRLGSREIHASNGSNWLLFGNWGKPCPLAIDAWSHLTSWVVTCWLWVFPLALCSSVCKPCSKRRMPVVLSIPFINVMIGRWVFRMQCIRPKINGTKENFTSLWELKEERCVLILGEKVICLSAHE